jgi:hypothetical protein
MDWAKVATACAVVMTCVMLVFFLGLLRRLELTSSPVSVVALTAAPPVPPGDALPLKDKLKVGSDYVSSSKSFRQQSMCSYFGIPGCGPQTVDRVSKRCRRRYSTQIQTAKEH